MRLPFPDPVTTTPYNPCAAAQSLLARLVTFIAVASGLASAGRQLDLTGLDRHAGLLCAQVMDLPHQDGVAMRAALQELDTKISALRDTIHARIGTRTASPACQS